MTEYTRVLGVGASESFAKLYAPATLAITSDGHVTLIKTDESGAQVGEYFTAPGRELRVNGSQQYLTFHLGKQKFHVDMSFYSRSSMSVTSQASSIATIGRELHRLDVIGWVKALRQSGAKVRYLTMRATVWGSILVSLLVVSIAVICVAVNTGGFR